MPRLGCQGVSGGEGDPSPLGSPLLLPQVRGLGPAHPALPVHPIHVRGSLLTFAVPVTQGRRPHVTQPDRPFAAAVHEAVAVVRVELGRRDHLCELLHVGRLNVHDIWHRRVKDGTGTSGQGLGGKEPRALVLVEPVSISRTQGVLWVTPPARGGGLLVLAEGDQGGPGRPGEARGSEASLALRFPGPLGVFRPPQHGEHVPSTINVICSRYHAKMC